MGLFMSNNDERGGFFVFEGSGGAGGLLTLFGPLRRANLGASERAML